MKTFVLTAFLCMIISLSFAQNTDSSLYFYKKGIEESAAQHFAVADKNFGKAIQLNPNFTEAYVADGKADIEMSRIYEANLSFTKAYQLRPDNNEIIKQLASLYFNNHQFQKAIDLEQKCTDCANADHIFGMSYYNTEDYAKALKFLQKAISENDKDAEAIYTLGRTYIELENEKDAIPQFQKAVTLEPSRNQWTYELGLIYYNQEDYKNALKCFDLAATNGYNKNNDYYENYGFAQIYAGDPANGVKTLTVVMERKPNNRELLNNIANAMYETKRYDDALAYFSRLLDLNPKDASSLFMAGMTFQKMGQKEKGEKICDNAIAMDPSLAKNRQKKDMRGGL